VNEAVHGTPFYADAIGGAGVTGYDWIVWAFNRTRTYCPNSKLHINDYDIIGFSANTTTYVNIIKALIANVNGTGSLIDGIGEQGHNYESTDVNVLKTNLAILASLGLPIHITEFDLDIADDTQHLNRFKTLFPIFYEYPQIQGVTVWGYLKGRTYKSTTWLYDPNGGTAASPPALAG
jgi:endo-1,4-beta-xylanase